jgi:hypothetical protein
VWYETFPPWLAARMAERGLQTDADLALFIGVPAHRCGEFRWGCTRPYREECARVAAAFEAPLDRVLLLAGYWVSPGP